MPRKNKSIPHTPYRHANNDKNKRRFSSHTAATKAAEYAMLMSPSLNLDVYRGLDGGWYLTSKEKP